ncbi:MAG: hypothetical protein WBW69_23710 [Candidatus Korobacteraceae bacterium]
MHKRNLTEAQLEARGKNAVAELLARRLIVPKVFFDAAWPSKLSRVDVLAVDRSGAGDIHAVVVKVGIGAAHDSIPQLMQVSAHFKYVAILNPGNRRLHEQALYREDGLGRLGVILFEEEEHDRLVAHIDIAPERFRVGPDVIRQIDRFTAKQHADIEIRV